MKKYLHKKLDNSHNVGDIINVNIDIENNKIKVKGKILSYNESTKEYKIEYDDNVISDYVINKIKKSLK